MWETWVPSLGWEDPLGRAWQPTPVFLPGEFPWSEEPGGLRFMGLKRVWHDWANKHSTAAWVSRREMTYEKCYEDSIYIRFTNKLEAFCLIRLMGSEGDHLYSFILQETSLQKWLGVPGGWVIKNLLANARATGDAGSIPGSGKSPGGRNGNPLQYSCLENPHGQRSLVGYRPRGHKELDTT